MANLTELYRVEFMSDMVQLNVTCGTGAETLTEELSRQVEDNLISFLQVYQESDTLK